MLTKIDFTAHVTIEEIEGHQLCRELQIIGLYDICDFIFEDFLIWPIIVPCITRNFTHYMKKFSSVV